MGSTRRPLPAPRHRSAAARPQTACPLALRCPWTPQGCAAGSQNLLCPALPLICLALAQCSAAHPRARCQQSARCAICTSPECSRSHGRMMPLCRRSAQSCSPPYAACSVPAAAAAACALTTANAAASAVAAPVPAGMTATTAPARAGAAMAREARPAMSQAAASAAAGVAVVHPSWVDLQEVTGVAAGTATVAASVAHGPVAVGPRSAA